MEGEAHVLLSLRTAHSVVLEHAPAEISAKAVLSPVVKVVDRVIAAIVDERRDFAVSPTIERRADTTRAILRVDVALRLVMFSDKQRKSYLVRAWKIGTALFALVEGVEQLHVVERSKLGLLDEIVEGGVLLVKAHVRVCQIVMRSGLFYGSGSLS